MQLIEAARKLLLDCLTLVPEAEIVVLFDDSASGVARAIADAAATAGIRATLLFFTTKMQLAHAQELPEVLRAVIRQSNAAITALSARTDATGFRIRIVNECIDSSIKLAHMPGITERVLATQADANYELILTASERVRDQLVGATTLKLRTIDSNGEEFTLSASIMGREPLKCGCRPQPGEITNVPCGEAFIAPIEDSASGTVVINGSMPGFAVPPHEEFKLTFKDGLLQHIHPEDTICVQEMLRIQQQAEKEGWEGWNRLCEVGIGTNPWVRELTGIPAVDEKASGTVHVAIGENTRIGGTNRSPVHLDFVTRPISILADERKIDTDVSPAVDT